MNNKENKLPKSETAPVKERTSVLEKIRRRTGLLVGIVGLALVIFILESLLGSGRTLFGGQDLSTVGKINGHKIDRNEFVAKFESQLNNYRQRNNGAEVDDNVRGQVLSTVWQQYVVDFAIMPQFEKVGIVVGEEEVYNHVVVNPESSIIQQLTDPNTGRVNEQFSNPDGTLNLMKWKQAVQNVTGESELAVKQMEDNVKNARFFDKFRVCINKGIYVTKAEAQNFYASQNDVLNVSYIHKSYDMIKDADVKVIDEEIQKYYSNNTYMFAATEDTRKIEYITFNVVPSAEDISAIEKDAQRIAADMKTSTFREDSNIMMNESENGLINVQNLSRKTMTIRDSSVYTAAVGSVFGPYNEGAYFKIYKLEAINQMADSARVRHILIGLSDPQNNQAKRSKEQAKREADSLVVLIKAKKANFDSLVLSISDDAGSKAKGGDYGWFDENKGFVEPFTNAGLLGTKGNLSVVETQFGYHIIEVLDVSKGHHKSYKVAQVLKPIVASDETNQKLFAQANQFAGENNTSDLFDKAVETQKLTKRLAEDIKINDRQMNGILNGAKEIVRWAFEAKKGDVGIFSLTDKHIVAKLSGIRNKGVLPLEEVKDQVAVKVKKELKANMIIQEFSTKAGSSKDINEMGSKLGIEVKKSPVLLANSQMIEGLGRDEIFMGTAIGTKMGGTSKAIAGENGVFVLTVNAVQKAPAPANYVEYKKQVQEQLTGRSDFGSFSAIKGLADIEDRTSKID
ncbi:MAG: SurA N-terminal domain-containing protein [Bacteroidota bacterium]